MAGKKIWNFVAAVVGGLAVIGVAAWQYNGQQDTIDWEKVTDYPAKKAGEKKKVGEEKDILQLQKVRYPKKDRWVSVDKAYLKNLKPFYQKSMSSLFLGKEGENCVYSPVNLYLSLAMLAEMTDGKTKSQLLDALGQKEIKKIREQSKLIWDSVYMDYGISECILGNSIWLNQDVPYQKEVLDTLAKQYYTESYQGLMGAGMDQNIQDWVNDITKNILEEEAGEIKSTPEMAFILMSAAYFYDQWAEPFDNIATKKNIFINADGDKSECDFMNRTERGGVYKTERFQSTYLKFEGGSNMFLFLPEKDVTLEDLFRKDMEEILHIASNFGIGFEEGGVSLSLPKFSMSSNLDLIPVMESMGIKDLFKKNEADFTKLIGKEDKNCPPVFVNKMKQASNATVDEEGCYVASFTETEVLMGAAGFKTIFKIVCDHPFFFVISDNNGIPVFAGAVNQL